MSDKNEAKPVAVTKKQRDDFELHVRLLQHKEGLKVAEARALAWSTGPMGLTKLLSS